MEITRRRPCHKELPRTGRTDCVLSHLSHANRWYASGRILKGKDTNMRSHSRYLLAEVELRKLLLRMLGTCYYVVRSWNIQAATYYVHSTSKSPEHVRVLTNPQRVDGYQSTSSKPGRGGSDVINLLGLLRRDLRLFAGFS
jgi:hypothetical protein